MVVCILGGVIGVGDSCGKSWMLVVKLIEDVIKSASGAVMAIVHSVVAVVVDGRL